MTSNFFGNLNTSNMNNGLNLNNNNGFNFNLNNKSNFNQNQNNLVNNQNIITTNNNNPNNNPNNNLNNNPNNNNFFGNNSTNNTGFTFQNNLNGNNRLGWNNQTGFNGNNQTGFNGNNQTGFNGNNQTGFNGNNQTGFNWNNQSGFNGNNQSGLNWNNQTGLNGNNQLGFNGNNQLGNNQNQYNNYSGNNQIGNNLNNYDLEFKQINDTIEDIDFINNTSFIFTSWEMIIGILEIKNNQLNLIAKKQFESVPLKISVNHNCNKILVNFHDSTAKIFDCNLNESGCISTSSLVIYIFNIKENFGIVKLNGEINLINIQGNVLLNKKFNKKINLACYEKTILCLVFEDNSYLIISINSFINNYNTNSNNGIFKLPNTMNQICSLDLSLEQNLITLGFIDGRINVINIENMNGIFFSKTQNQKRFLAHANENSKDTSSVNDLIIVDSNRMISSSSIGQLTFWDFHNKNILKNYNLKNLINGFKISPLKDFIVVKGGYDWCLGISGITNEKYLCNKNFENSIGIIYTNK